MNKICRYLSNKKARDGYYKPSQNQSYWRCALRAKIPRVICYDPFHVNAPQPKNDHKKFGKYPME
jgi:hypothetical protein